MFLLFVLRPVHKKLAPKFMNLTKQSDTAPSMSYKRPDLGLDLKRPFTGLNTPDDLYQKRESVDNCGLNHERKVVWKFTQIDNYATTFAKFMPCTTFQPFLLCKFGH